ncbi:unnamed protein product, partial [Discosporangium mesarthrocarpum]
SHLSNELEVVVVGCEGLPVRGSGVGRGNPPAAYVHYQLLGFQDVFTSVSHGTCDPQFRHSMTFPLVTDDRILRFLGRSRTRFRRNPDFVVSYDDDESEGLLGEARVDLSPLAEGMAVTSRARVEDTTGRAVGFVTVTVRWCQPLRSEGDPGPHGLTAVEVEGLMERFSPEKDGQV